MANYESHHLFGLNIKEALIEGGYVGPKTLTSKAHPKGVAFEFVLDYAKCNPDEWKKQLAAILERGVVDFGKQNPDGSRGVRRDYTPEEQAELGFYPVRFNDDGTEMIWSAAWRSNDDPAYYASCALKNTVLILDKFYEAEYDGGGYLKSGTFIGPKPEFSFEDFDGEIDILVDSACEALEAMGLAGVAHELRVRLSHDEDNSEKFATLLTYINDKYDEPEDCPDVDPFDSIYAEANAETTVDAALESDFNAPF